MTEVKTFNLANNISENETNKENIIKDDSLSVDRVSHHQILSYENRDKVIEVRDLNLHFDTYAGEVKAIRGVSFDIYDGEVLALVGESGCGKSVTSLSIMQLVQSPQGQVVGGQIRFNSDDLGEDENGNKLAYDIAKMPTKQMYNVRGKDITMIFQEPMTSLNPIFTIGNQMDEVMFIHYPDGGMRQRVMIAMALSGNPKLIIADEPTTALDVTIQAQILDLLKSIQKKTGCAIMLITHDLGVIAEMADEVVVMYAGRVIEKGTVREIFYTPKHPYTIGLQKSKPLITSDANEPLYSIPGQVPNPINMPDYCFFKDRCNRCTKACDGHYPTVSNVSPTHLVYCHLYDNQNKGGNDEK